MRSYLLLKDLLGWLTKLLGRSCVTLPHHQQGDHEYKEEEEEGELSVQ